MLLFRQTFSFYILHEGAATSDARARHTASNQQKARMAGTRLDWSGASVRCRGIFPLSPPPPPSTHLLVELLAQLAVGLEPLLHFLVGKCVGEQGRVAVLVHKRPLPLQNCLCGVGVVIRAKGVEKEGGERGEPFSSATGHCNPPSPGTRPHHTTTCKPQPLSSSNSFMILPARSNRASFRWVGWGMERQGAI